MYNLSRQDELDVQRMDDNNLNEHLDEEDEQDEQSGD